MSLERLKKRQKDKNKQIKTKTTADTKTLMISSHMGSSYPGSEETNLTSSHEGGGSIPGLAQWVKDLALL